MLRLFIRAATLYLKHLAVALPGIWIACMVLGALPASLGVIWLFGIPNGAPYFAGWLVAGAVLGYRLNSRERTLAACFVFVPALVLLLSDLPSVLHMPIDGGWAGVWIAYFSRQCGGSECLGEAMMTAPLYATVAYSLAAWFALRRGHAQARTDQNPSA